MSSILIKEALVTSIQPSSVSKTSLLSLRSPLSTTFSSYLSRTLCSNPSSLLSQIASKPTWTPFTLLMVTFFLTFRYSKMNTSVASLHSLLMNQKESFITKNLSPLANSFSKSCSCKSILLTL